MPIRAGEERCAAADAPSIARLRAAGAVPLCVTNTPEACLWWESFNEFTGSTRNPYDSRLTAGGSSGGEVRTRRSVPPSCDVVRCPLPVTRNVTSPCPLPSCRERCSGRQRPCWASARTSRAPAGCPPSSAAWPVTSPLQVKDGDAARQHAHDAMTPGPRPRWTSLDNFGFGALAASLGALAALLTARLDPSRACAFPAHLRSAWAQGLAAALPVCVEGPSLVGLWPSLWRTGHTHSNSKPAGRFARVGNDPRHFSVSGAALS